jgi:CheY-like chemotaxis protein
MDIQLPVIDGCEATDGCRTSPHPNPVPITAVTSYAMAPWSVVKTRPLPQGIKAMSVSTASRAYSAPVRSSLRDSHTGYHHLTMSEKGGVARQ